MRTGIVTDSHQHLAALRATLDGPLADCDRIISLGDFVNRGPDDPAAMLNLLLERNVEILLGNHELAYLGGPSHPEMQLQDEGQALAPRLAKLVTEERMQCATHVGDHLVVHAGMSREFWMAYVQPTCGDNVEAIAYWINRHGMRAIAKGELQVPLFAGLNAQVPGPIWARLGRHLPPNHPLPPFAQVVGHTPVDAVVWYDDIAGGPGTLCATDVAGGMPVDGLIGHVILDD